MEKTTITELKRRKRKWFNDTLSHSYLLNNLKLKEEEIKEIKSETLYGKTRYIYQCALDYIKLKLSHNNSADSKLKK